MHFTLLKVYTCNCRLDCVQECTVDASNWTSITGYSSARFLQFFYDRLPKFWCKHIGKSKWHDNCACSAI